MAARAARRLRSRSARVGTFPSPPPGWPPRCSDISFICSSVMGIRIWSGCAISRCRTLRLCTSPGVVGTCGIDPPFACSLSWRVTCSGVTLDPTDGSAMLPGCGAARLLRCSLAIRSALCLRLGERPLRSSQPGTACGCVSSSKPACASALLTGCSCSLLMADLRCSAPPRLAPPAAGAPPAPPPDAIPALAIAGLRRAPAGGPLRPLEPHSDSGATAASWPFSTLLDFVL
jgi:hypothetical protein